MIDKVSGANQCHDVPDPQQIPDLCSITRHATRDCPRNQASAFHQWAGAKGPGWQRAGLAGRRTGMRIDR